MSRNIFERYEKKYLISARLQEVLLKRFSDKVEPDQYGSYAISNIYYDTDNYDLIRNSIEKPCYKEKLRMRSYGNAEEDSLVYVELKKKFKGVVYKRRLPMSYSEARLFLQRGETENPLPQIGREIQYFLKKNAIHEKIFLGYQRKAFRGICDRDLRITFDTNIKFRQFALTLSDNTSGQNVIKDGESIMEIKFLGAMPLWLSRELSELSVYPTSFSKYGACYQRYILKTETADKEVEKSA